MNHRLRSLAMPLVAAGAVTVLTVGIVSARSGGNDSSPLSTVASAPQALAGDLGDYMSDLAKNLGITDDELSAALTKTSNARIDQLLADGKITQQEADQLKEAVADGHYFAGELPRDGDHIGPRGFGFKGFMGGGALFDAFNVLSDDVASYLGLSKDDLRTKLADGQSLADIAQAQGKTADGLKDAITTSAKKQLDAAVADETLTQEQADDIAKKLADNLDDIVNGQLPRFEGHGQFPGIPGLGGMMGGAELLDAFTAVTDDVAAYVGLSTEDLRTKVADGQSLATIAVAQGKTVDGLKQAIIGSAKKQLDGAVADKTITQAQADDLSAKLDEHLDDIVNAEIPDLGELGQFGGGLFGGRRFDFGHDFHFQFPGSPDDDASPTPEPTTTSNRT